MKRDLHRRLAMRSTRTLRTRPKLMTASSRANSCDAGKPGAVTGAISSSIIAPNTTIATRTIGAWPACIAACWCAWPELFFDGSSRAVHSVGIGYIGREDQGLPAQGFDLAFRGLKSLDSSSQ